MHAAALAAELGCKKVVVPRDSSVLSAWGMMLSDLRRDYFATHLIENGADLPTVQALLGHADLKATSIYLHLSQRHLKAAGTPLDKIEVTTPLDQVKRSRKLQKRPPEVKQK